MKKKIAQKELIEATNLIFDNFKKKNQNKTKKIMVKTFITNRKS